MKAFALASPGQFKMFETDIPLPGDNDIQVKVKVCGVCSSEVAVWKDLNPSEPLFLGHEVSGEVSEVGKNVKRFKKGDRVSVLAEKGFAEYVCVNEEHAVPLSDETPYELGLGEPLACAMNATKRTNVEIGDTVAIIGLGFMGQLILQGVKLKGASTIIAIDTREEALEMAKELGAASVINAKEDVHKKIMEMTNDNGVDVVIEATGTQPALDLATDIVKIRGSLIIYGYHQGPPRTINMQQWNWKGLDVVNAHERDPKVYMQGMKLGIKLLEEGLIKMAPLVTHTFSLEEVNKAFESSVLKPEGFFKAVIKR
ncbi:MDR/zinc-dependent alcohol dehydrogenase-like family protein [Lederbergia panacisoli]|uniref:MDR/zinc-dependent alcohol dehydrogenase-like family protein n=1 Tax=Lederbergia panacisoli TaxID=1255251 RepID=UPI00214A9641|nr:zinc-binding dehydrogenase [Lederbergia panacisoli]MCR2821525.1 zinc-binding dehydrogenase [Lederbergia panacisoli]